MGERERERERERENRSEHWEDFVPLFLINANFSSVCFLLPCQLCHYLILILIKRQEKRGNEESRQRRAVSPPPSTHTQHINLFSVCKEQFSSLSLDSHIQAAQGSRKTGLLWWNSGMPLQLLHERAA